MGCVEKALSCDTFSNMGLYHITRVVLQQTRDTQMHVKMLLPVERIESRQWHACVRVHGACVHTQARLFYIEFFITQITTKTDYSMAVCELQFTYLKEFLQSLFVAEISGVARIWCQGGTTNEAPKGAEWSGYGEGCPLPNRLWGLGERREFPQPGPGRSPAHYRIFCIF